MAERTVRSYDPLMYHVNSVDEFDPEIVVAYKSKNSQKLQELLNVDRYDFDIFICVNKGYHAFVMCVGASTEPNPIGLYPEFSDDPYDIPELSFVHQFELRFEIEAHKTYKIAKKMEVFKNIKDKIQRYYYIGRYRQVAVRGFQLAALAAAPTRYSVLLDDCVEFSKEFCVRLLSYCGNWKTLEKSVEENIRKATATGLSAEQLSRRVRSSAYSMNSFLTGLDTSALFSERSRPILVLFLLVYPVVIAVIVSMVIVYFMK